jgi:plastocyanin
VRPGRIRLSLLALPLAILASACSSGGKPSQPITGPFVQVQETDFQFAPSSLVMSNGFAIILANHGTALHNFTIEGTSIDADTQAGSTTRLHAPRNDLPPGKYQFFCKYHRSQGMVGTITVVTPGAPPSPSS